jgi:CRP-like cAMP-binding protein
MALLTHSPRSATIKAKSRCSVVKVPKDQFKNLIRTNPTMIHGLLTDMARQIKKLNHQVVELSEKA